MGSLGESEETFHLITRGIAEENILGADLIRSAIAGERRRLRCLWVTSPTGKPHLGYFLPILKFADLLKAGVEVVVLILDVYSFLDNVKYPIEQVAQRGHYYKFTVMAALEALGIPASKVHFVEETSYQFTKQFVIDQWKLCTLVPQQAVRDSWDRSVHPDILSPMLCPGLQALAEEYLDIDIAFGGTDQRGLFEFAERFIPQLGYRKRAHMMNLMMPNLLGGTMSSSHPPSTKLMFLDSPEALIQKISGAYKADDTAGNAVLVYLRDIVFPASKIRLEGFNSGGVTDITKDKDITSNQWPLCPKDAPTGTLFSVGVDGENGLSYRHYGCYNELEQDLAENKLAAGPLAAAIADALNQLLDPVRKLYEESAEWQKADRLAYPKPA